MSIEIMVIVAAFALGGFFSAESETIKFRPKESWFPNWGWWTGEKSLKRTWLIKYPLSFLHNGYHCTRALEHFYYSIPAAFVLTKDWYVVLVYALLFYSLIGGVFNITYGNDPTEILHDKS